MTRDLGSSRLGSPISPRLESRPSGSYIDFRFSRQSSQGSQPSISDGYNSEDYIDICFPREQEIQHIDNLVEKLQALKAQSAVARSKERAERVAEDKDDVLSRIELNLVENDFKDRRFLRVSADSLRVDVEDFYVSLTLGLDSLKMLANSPFFLSADFLQQSITLLQILDNDVMSLLQKLSDLRHPNSEEFCRALLEYTKTSAKILEVCNAVKFSTTLLKKYQSCRADASVVAVEALVALPKGSPRAVHVSKAKEAGQCIDSAQAEMLQMRAEVKSLVESSNYGSFSNLVPSLNIADPEASFSKWSGLWGVLFAMKTTSFYISQLLLAGLAHAGEGPAIIVASTNTASFNSSWASSLARLHIQVRKQFNKMKDSNSGTCSFMSRDNDLLEFMLQDTKGHLRSLLDQGKFLNIGVYLGSWQTDKKKLMHNVPRLRRHLQLARHRLSTFTESIEALASTMSENLSYGRGHLDRI